MSGPAEDAATPLVDEGALRAFLEEHLPAKDADLTVERHQAGHSNETFFVTWGDRELVLRRPPRGAFLPTAHDVLREYRVMDALQDTPARVPRTITACEDESVIGVPFYLCERVRGRVIRSRVPEPWGSPDARRRLGEELVDALAEIHNVAWEGTPLEKLGKPTGYAERQVTRWRSQLELTAPHTAEAREVPELMEVGDWLAARVPESPRTTVVHGDYKLDNVMFAGDAPRLRAVLDWEMSTLGDPLADLGWMLSFWREPGDPAKDMLSVEPRFTEDEGFLPRRALVKRYEEKTGTRVSGLDWYRALAVWKLAILLEGSFARHLAGVTDDPFFAEMESGVPALARRALAFTKSSG